MAGYVDRPADFDDLEQILESDLRLITPVDVLPTKTEGGTVYYQLTHDYLVPSIREWLRLNQTTADRILEERVWGWSEKREHRQLPLLSEWIQVYLRTDRSRWTAQQRSMMREAAKLHVARAAKVVFVMLLLVILLQWKLVQKEREQFAATINNLKSDVITAELTKADELGPGLYPLLQRKIDNPDKPQLNAAADKSKQYPPGLCW